MWMGQDEEEEVELWLKEKSEMLVLLLCLEV